MYTLSIMKGSRQKVIPCATLSHAQNLARMYWNLCPVILDLDGHPMEFDLNGIPESEL